MAAADPGQSSTQKKTSEPTHLCGSVAYARPMNFDQTAARGNKLLRHLETPSAYLEKALEADKKYQPQKFTHSDLAKYGWEVVPEPNYNPMEKLTVLTDIPAVAKLLNGSACYGIDAYHSSKYNLQGPEEVEEFEPTSASYSAVYSPGSGVIIATLNESPRHSLIRREMNEQEPALRHWSDLAFLVYQDLCKQSIPEVSVRDLKHIFRSSITNEKTQSIIKPVLRRRRIDYDHFRRTGWAWRQVFDVHTEEGRALLASPNGRGVAWLLLRYREQLGWKRVKRISVFGMGDTKVREGVSLYFELEDVEERP